MDESLHDKLNRETARINWAELAPFFAKGQMWCVSAEADLIEVAMAIAEDNAEQVQQWQQSGVLFQPSDEHATQWTATNQAMWATVIAPWVITQCVQSNP